MIYTPENQRLAFRITPSSQDCYYNQAHPTLMFSLVRTGRKVDWVRRLIPKAVLLPMNDRQKHPNLRGWQLKTYDGTQQGWYQARLNDSPNTGVALGRKSDGLCTIDLDTDEDAEAFLSANPRLRRTLITKGRRGLNVWVKVIDAVPPLQKFGWGEWRSDRGLTAIAGIHPSGTPYRYVNEAPPVDVLFSDIVFPFEDKPEKPEVLHNIGFLIEPSRSASPPPTTQDLYAMLVGKYLKPHPHTRNRNLTDSVSFLFYQVSPEIAFELGMMIYDKHADVWNDPRARHELECKHLLKSIAKDYPSRLPPKAKAIFDKLKEKEQHAFRICFSLSRDKDDNVFFLSVRQIAARLGLGNATAGKRVLDRLTDAGVIKPIQKGFWGSGKATSYRWLLRGKLQENADTTTQPLKSDAT